MRIAVYTGTFNPLHIGHQAIMERLTDSGAFDMVYLVVSAQSPFKGAEHVKSARSRYRKAVAALRRHPGIMARADDIELRMEPPSYTIRTLDALREREPGNSFTLVMGADNLAGISGWRDYKRILSEYGVVVYPRRGYDTEQIAARLHAENPGYRISLLDAPMVDISSTRIREAVARGEDMSEYLM